MNKLIASMVLLGSLASFVYGHGMMLDPVGRGSRWRYDRSAIANYNDNENFCGGGAVSFKFFFLLKLGFKYIFMIQKSQLKGNCGFCGDSPRLAQPRPHELGGTYGQGVIVKTYKQQQNIDISINLATNHLGYFEFELCNLDKHGKESDACFQENKLDLIEGGKRKYIGSSRGLLKYTVVIPSGLRCEHCVIRWIYRAGNNWGFCNDGSGRNDCGPQEYYVHCADIKIQ